MGLDFQLVLKKYSIDFISVISLNVFYGTKNTRSGVVDALIGIGFRSLEIEYLRKRSLT